MINYLILVVLVCDGWVAAWVAVKKLDAGFPGRRASRTGRVVVGAQVRCWGLDSWMDERIDAKTKERESRAT